MTLRPLRLGLAALPFAFLPAISAANTILVRPDGSGDFPTIQAALDAAVGGDEVVLANGSYQGVGNRDLRFHGKSLVLRSESGNPATCIIHPEMDGRGLIFDGGENRDAQVIGITVNEADARREPSYECGAGIFCKESSPTIRNCAFRRCFADSGGGVYAKVSSPLIQECTFYWCNMAVGGGTSGGAINSQSSTIQIEDCLFDLNLCEYGAGIFSHNSTIHVLRSVFKENIAIGAALSGDSGTTFDLSGCTLAFNEGGAQVMLAGGSSLRANHTIIAFGDYPEQQVSILCDAGSTASLTCCDVYGNSGGDWVGCLAGQEGSYGNSHLDPIFCSVWDGSLRADSPCAAQNNPTCGQIGALGVACDVPVPAKKVTWGALKATFR